MKSEEEIKKHIEAISNSYALSYKEKEYIVSTLKWVLADGE